MPARFSHCLTLATFATVLGYFTPVQAAEVDPTDVLIKTPEQFKWRDANMQAPNNAVVLGDPAKAGSLYAHINSFVPGHFGEAHYHPNDRYIMVIDGAPGAGGDRSSTRTMRPGCRRAPS